MMSLRQIGKIADKMMRATSFLKIENAERFLSFSVHHGKNSQSSSKPTTLLSTHRSRSSSDTSWYRKSSSSSNTTITNRSTLLGTTSRSEQPVASTLSSRTSSSESPSIGQLQVNTLTPPLAKSRSSQDVGKESSLSGEAADKTQPHLLKTSLDQALGGRPPDDVSLLASRRIDPSTVRQVYYFDTLAFTKKLESSGFTRQQAEGCAECLVEIINSTLDHQGRHMVTKPQQEIAVQQLMSEIVSVKKDMTLLQKSEFSALKTETEKMSIELSQVQGHMNDEIVKLKGQFSLDINLERGRAIEAHAENEKKLQQLHNKIETEIANLKTIYEIYRNDIFKYAGGTVIAVGTLMLGVVRLWH